MPPWKCPHTRSRWPLSPREKLGEVTLAARRNGLATLRAATFLPLPRRILAGLENVSWCIAQIFFRRLQPVRLYDPASKAHVTWNGKLQADAKWAFVREGTLRTKGIQPT